MIRVRDTPRRGSSTFINRFSQYACVLVAGCILLTAPRSLVAQTTSDGTFADLSASADSAREAGDVARAVQLYEKAVQLNPQWALGWWYLGTLQYGNDAYGAATDALTHYLALTPKAAPALALRGQCELELGQYAESLRDLEQSIALGAANEARNAGILYFGIARDLTKLGRFEESIAQYTVLIRHGVRSNEVVNGLGLAGLHMATLPRDIQAGQQELVAATGQAAATVLSGDFSGGRQQFEQVFQRFPAMAWLHYFYGYLLFETHPREAIAQFQEELRIAPANAIVHAMLAWGLGMQGDYAAALPDAQKSVEENPTLGLAQLVLGRDQLETGDVKGSLAHLETALGIEPQNLEVHLALAKAWSELGRKNDARRERLQCLALAEKRAAPDANM